MSVVDRSFDHPLNLEERASMPMAGGLMQYGFQCGMLWGAALAAGAQAHQRLGPGPQAEAEAILAAQNLVDAFRTRNKSINCSDIAHLNKSSTPMDMVMQFLIKGGVFGCFRMAVNYAPAAFEKIDRWLPTADDEAPSHPVSCAAELARKMGASDLHIVMAAGFAGGIGLSGGACGALGAAIWLTSMESIAEGADQIDFNDPKASALVDQFVEATNYEFECAEIVGGKFESVGEHADYISNGGCSKIIEVLVSS
jgi:hypothetical protein